jgi:hypothetical protein
MILLIILLLPRQEYTDFYEPCIHIKTYPLHEKAFSYFPKRLFEAENFSAQAKNTG